MNSIQNSSISVFKSFAVTRYIWNFGQGLHEEFDLSTRLGTFGSLQIKKDHNRTDSLLSQERRVDSEVDLARMGYSVYDARNRENR